MVRRLGAIRGYHRAEIPTVEQVTDQLAGRGIDHHRVGSGRQLQPRRQDRRGADDLLDHDLVVLDPIANDDNAGCSANPASRRSAGGSLPRGAHCGRYFKPGTDGQFGVVFMGHRVTEHDEQRIALTVDDKSIVPRDDFRDAALLRRGCLAHGFKIAVGGFRQADQFTGHRSDLTTFGTIPRCRHVSARCVNARRAAGLNRRAQGRVPHRPPRRRRQGRGLSDNGSDETISAPRQLTQQPLIGVAQCAADFFDTLGNAVVGHEDARPHCAHDLVAVDEATGILDKKPQ